jgi:hypothetical protein
MEFIGYNSMATALEESVPSIIPPESGITRKKVLNMDTLHDCRYVNRGDLVVLPGYAKELFLEGLALHLKRTQNITDIPIDPEESAMDGKYGRIAEMIEELFPDTEDVEHPEFADLETDMANYFVAAGYNIRSTREDEEMGGISIYDNSPSLKDLLGESTAIRNAQFDVYKEILIGPGMMYTTADAGFKIFGDLAEDHPLVTAFFTPQTVADSAGKSYKQLGANLNVYRSFTPSPTTNFKSISNIFTSERGMRFEYIVDSFEGEKLWNFKYKISGPPGEVIFDFDTDRLSGTSLAGCGCGYVSGLPIVENDINPHLDDEKQREKMKRLLNAQFNKRPSMLDTGKLLDLKIPEIFLDMKRCQDSDQALAAYYANKSEEMRGRVVFVTGDRMCFLLAILLGLASVLSLQTTGGTYMWYWSPKKPFRTEVEIPVETPVETPLETPIVTPVVTPVEIPVEIPINVAVEPVPPVLTATEVSLFSRIRNIIRDYICRPLVIFLQSMNYTQYMRTGGGEEQNIPPSERNAFRDICNLANVHIGNIIAKQFPEIHNLALLSNGIQKAEYSKSIGNINSKKSAMIDLLHALSVLNVSEKADVYELLEHMQTYVPNSKEHITKLYSIIDAEAPKILDALLNLLTELGYTKWPTQLMTLIKMIGDKSHVMSRVLLSMAIISLLDAPTIKSTLYVNTGSSVYWSIYGLKDITNAGEDVYFASLNYIINDDTNSVKNKEGIITLANMVSRSPSTSIIKMRTGINHLPSPQPIMNNTLLYGGRRTQKKRNRNATKKKQKKSKRRQTRRN